MTTIRIACDGARVSLSELKVIQGDLKTLTKERFQELTKAIEDDGFSFAVHYWVNPETGEKCILDGTQRYRVASKNIEDGKWAPFQIPTVKIEAPDYKSAVKTLLHGASSYGTPDSQGYYELTEGAGLTVEDLKEVALAGIDQKKHEAEYYEDPASSEGEDEIPEPPKVARTKRGELWILGNHRLLIDDCTVKENVERLMAGEKADMVFTDPPYGVSYTEKNEWLNSLGEGHRLTKAIENDSNTVPEMKVLWDGFLAATALACHNKASYYVCSPQGGELMMMMMIAISDSPWQLKHTIIWVKNNHVLGRCDYNYKHEPILYGWKKDGTHDFIGAGRCKTSVWDFNKPLKNDLHPTMKPVELVEEALANSCPNGGKVVDVFLGSGTTLIAAEKTGRKCFGSEIEPLYADVIISRWEKFSGKSANREDGVGFSELA